ncbi:hypothetical protein QUF61_18030 [Candidatus Venteria ishoeyi]|uniref:hypothetical protein n=1 Tax=Candidatus Venteria ishoeyi TaxID=1899563 RepID=UPI0025A4CC58|nr:hypothetical protein [Candidatus Venteria ishoeyi]MDM8548394.1 hypothetical protein [Candidatus Venteria ishoeyi]
MVGVAIFHEGSSKKTADNELLNLLITNLNLDNNKIRFIGIGGKSNFFNLDNKNYSTIKMAVRREEINKILFVIDADYEKNDEKYGGYDNTETELKKIIHELELQDCSDIYITCDPQTKDGYLESLILSTIPEKQKSCIENFLNCSDFKSKENHKAILNQIYKTAYPQAPFDFSHQNFDELKQKLTTLFSMDKHS